MACTKQVWGILLLGIIGIGSCDAFSIFKIINVLGDKVWRTFNDNVPNVLNPFNLLYTNSCIEDLGCFYTGPPFYHPLRRPFSFPPSIRINEIYFLLFTQASPNKTYMLKSNLESLKKSTFNATHKTKVLIHGFLVDLDFEDIRYNIKDAVIKDPADYNVIVVDWTKLNSPPYFQAVANTRVVGAKLAQLINFIINSTATTAENFQIVGHSLGAHIAGYAGQRIKNLGRITGLDPAGPYFRDCHPEVRLDKTDALFVDVIHTGGGEFVLTGLGINDPIGHVDFYPNGGQMQPGCNYFGEGVVGTAVNFFWQFLPVSTQYINSGCDHGRANDYYLESVNNYDCRFLAVQCSDYNDFEAGRCPPGNHTVTVMGFHSAPLTGIKPPATFFLRTNGKSPFCQENSICI